MAIIFNNKKEYHNFVTVTHPDKFKGKPEEYIANKIATKTLELYEKAKKEGYPFEYEPEKDEYCFLVSNGYKDEGFINDDLQDLYKDKCKELQKNNFSFANQILIIEHLNGIPEHKHDKIISSYVISSDGKEHQNSELNDALLCIQGISDEC